MTYALQVSGLIAPLVITSPSVPPAAKGVTYGRFLGSSNGSGPITWSVVGGVLPPGLRLDTSGFISGIATTYGTYTFTVQAKDSGTQPQVVTAQFSIQVVDPVKITSPTTWPDACLNQPYSFAVQISGGVQPIQYSFVSNGIWPQLNLNQATGVFSGTPDRTGTFFGNLGVNDAASGYLQSISVTVNQCP
jgi:hypothetical protein